MCKAIFTISKYPRKAMTMDSRKVRITSKRQITIPKKYYDMLGIWSEAECILRNGEAYNQAKQCRLENWMNIFC